MRSDVPCEQGNDEQEMKKKKSKEKGKGEWGKVK